MSLGLRVTGEIASRGLLKGVPSGEEILGAIDKFVTTQQDPLLRRLVKKSREGGKLYIDLHPAAEPVEFLARDKGQVICSAATNAAGPGYHRHLVHLLDGCGKALGIRWIWQGPASEPTDETGYAIHRDYGRLQDAMLEWLGMMVRLLVEKADGGFFGLCMPIQYSVVVDSFAYSPLGLWQREWFQRAATAPDADLAGYGEAFFPWWGPGEDGRFWLNTARVLLWMECPWHLPASDEERSLYRAIDDCLETAYQLDRSLPFPWGAWKDVLGFLRNGERLSVLANRPQGPDPEPEIGFRRKMMYLPLVGGWRARLPGYFYCRSEQRGATVVYWYGDKTVHASSYAVAGGDRSAASVAETLRVRHDSLYLEVYDHKDERVEGWAGLTRDQEAGKQYWTLSACSAAPGHLCLLTICFPRREDLEWALDTWRSARLSGQAA